MSIEATERECAANATAPRVSLADIEAAIEDRWDFNGIGILSAARDSTETGSVTEIFENPAHIVRARKALARLSVCVLVMRNGFIVIGKSAPADPTNYNAELGAKLAYEDAVRQLWPLMGFALRDRLCASHA